MRAGPLQNISAFLFLSALLSTPLAAQSTAPPTDAATAPPDYRTTTPLRRIGGSVSSPVVMHTVDPKFSEEARKSKFMGVVLINLIVDTNGVPQNVHILRGVGMGLDEQALIAVKQYRFKPAMEGGKPVPVELNVEVNFQIFDGPKVLHSVPLELTDEARQAHASGTILVAFTVDTQGNAHDVHVTQGVGMGMDERAVQAVRQYKFQPFVDANGQPVAKATTLPLNFAAR